MRSAAVLAFSGLAVASYIPPAYEAPSQAAPVTPSPVYEELPSETEYSTQVVTITSCADDVVSCPADSTVISSSVVPLTTSTVYETRVHTISKCGDEVVDCPYESKTEVVVTETIAISTTVCPVDEVHPTPAPSGGEEYPAPSGPAGGDEYPAPSGPAGGDEYPAPSGPAGGDEYPAPSGGEEYPQPSGPAHPEVPESEVPHVPSASYPVPPPPATTHDAIPTLPASEPALCPTESVKTIVYSTEITTVVPTVLTKYETATLEVPCPEPTNVVPTGGYPVPPPAAPSSPANGTIPGAPVPSGPAEAGAAGLSGSVFVAAFAAVAAFVFA